MSIQFWELPTVNQCMTLKTDSKLISLISLEVGAPFIPHIQYDKAILKTLYRNPQITAKFQLPNVQRHIRSVIQTLSVDYVQTEFNLDTLWGFALVYAGRYELICQNKSKSNVSTDMVLVIDMDVIINPNNMILLYPDAIAPRWNLMYSMVGFGGVCLLLDAANKFTIPIL